MYRPTLLEDSLDPWLAQEPGRDRRLAVIDWLSLLCAADGRLPGRRIPDTARPAFVAFAPGTGVIIVWVIADAYEEVAVRRLIDVRTGRTFGQ